MAWSAVSLTLAGAWVLSHSPYFREKYNQSRCTGEYRWEDNPLFFGRQSRALIMLNTGRDKNLFLTQEEARDCYFHDSPLRRLGWRIRTALSLGPSFFTDWHLGASEQVLARYAHIIAAGCASSKTWANVGIYAKCPVTILCFHQFAFTSAAHFMYKVTCAYGAPSKRGDYPANISPYVEYAGRPGKNVIIGAYASANERVRALDVLRTLHGVHSYTAISFRGPWGPRQCDADAFHQSIADAITTLPPMSNIWYVTSNKCPEYASVIIGMCSKQSAHDGNSESVCIWTKE